MYAAYENALRTIADCYEAESERWGGRSLSRVATIVLNSGTFFERLRAGKTFTVVNLEKMTTWMRDPANWPDSAIPHEAALALTSMGRPPVTAFTADQCGKDTALVACDRSSVSQQAQA